MKIISCRASRKYDVMIGSGILPQIRNYLYIMHLEKAVIISDSNVYALYGHDLETVLDNEGIKHCHYILPAGENSKNAESYLDILNFLAENEVTRSDVLIALGGGVVGDITGFVAATYLRGIRYLQVPTTLMAMVDSSVGGKTAINLPAGKNLAGAFYQPSLVLCDLDTLKTLPTDNFRDGCAEAIKYGILYDPELFVHLLENSLSFDLEYVVSSCVALKRDVVHRDEFDQGERKMLNLGHTIGHSIEANSNLTVSHGQSVAIGMATVAKAGCAAGICSEECYQQIISILNKFELPTKTELSLDALYQGALSDKKRNNQVINLIVPQTIGKCMIYPLEISELKSFIEAGL